jgi:hypothetical protein
VYDGIEKKGGWAWMDAGFGDRGRAKYMYNECLMKVYMKESANMKE